ncbi:hypothetical protein [Brevibacillus fulvus]|uniref:Uncharacterized protein n=1 Tax=Brevibacillus fulvus TaxID=1125967 RepID=A0A938XZV7_9BACL|nr:hypothetical protein [Brevibacillus fulvus]MBM7589919.1 hypothetical protein [Brevibacillus fulvus]
MDELLYLFSFDDLSFLFPLLLGIASTLFCFRTFQAPRLRILLRTNQHNQSSQVIPLFLEQYPPFVYPLTILLHRLKQGNADEQEETSYDSYMGLQVAAKRI